MSIAPILIIVRGDEMIKATLCVVGVMSITGCTLKPADYRGAEDGGSGYTYIPLDPLPVVMTPRNCPPKDVLPNKSSQTPIGTVAKKPVNNILSALPDNAVRMVVENLKTSGNITYGAGKIGSNLERYKVTSDYISADTVSIKLWISRQVREKVSSRSYTHGVQGDISGWKDVSMSDNLVAEYRYANTTSEYKEVVAERYFVKTDKQYQKEILNRGAAETSKYTVYSIPLYVGIGIRITSNVEVIGGSANISGIGVIGAEAQANKLQGSLVVQTLGVNGKAVSSALPMQSELNATTAQNALIATASIKTLLYADDTEVAPRIVGLYYPFPSSRPLVNALISAISSSEVEWSGPCSID